MDSLRVEAHPPSPPPPKHLSSSTHHQLPPRIFDCVFCEKSFRWKWHLELHTHKHTGERPYFCSECELCLQSSSARALHLQGVHRGIKYQCDFCSTSFSQLGNLYTHRRNLHGVITTKSERKLFRMNRSFVSASNKKKVMTEGGNSNGEDSIDIEDKHNGDEYHIERPLKTRIIHDVSFFLHLNRYIPDSA